ncbi:MAG: DUF3800 domain-containing protein [Patescibacteria group bacterium]|nr:DUF3800 domain-containing protein [Patescibacteria group bacterium]
MIVIYLDESGALNNIKRQRYFVIGALVIETEKNWKKLKNLYRKLYVKHCLPNKINELHASKLDLPIKQDILQSLNNLACFRLDYIVTDKVHLNPELFKEKNICYNYLVTQLVKKIVKNYQEPVKVILDNHTIKVKSLNSLRDHILIEARTKWNFNHNIEVVLMDSKNSKGVQLVDVVVNAIFAKYNYNKVHLYNINDSNYRHRIRFPYAKFGQI